MTAHHALRAKLSEQCRQVSEQRFPAHALLQVGERVAPLQPRGLGDLGLLQPFLEERLERRIVARAAEFLESSRGEVRIHVEELPPARFDIPH